MQDPPVDPGTYAKIVTRDATPAAGAAAACAPNIRSCDVSSTTSYNLIYESMLV